MQSILTRRRFTALALGSAALKAQVAPAQTPAPPPGTVIATERPAARIHTLMAPEQAVFVTSHIIELADRLVIVDAQLLPPHARQLRDLANALRKPIDRVILSHAHQDHANGLSAFRDVPSFATARVRTTLQMRHNTALTNPSAPPVEVPSRALEVERETIGGLTFQYRVFADAEADEQVVIMLPELATIIAQDLAYNRVHLYLGEQKFDEWSAILRRFAPLASYVHVLCGHGEPAPMGVFLDNMAYLEAAKAIFAANRTPEAIRTALIARFPDYRGPRLIDIGLRRIFPN